jgi:hypothetical protein
MSVSVVVVSIKAMPRTDKTNNTKMEITKAEPESVRSIDLKSFMGVFSFP